MHGAMGGGTNGAGHVNMGLPYKAYKAEQVSAMQVMVVGVHTEMAGYEQVGMLMQGTAGATEAAGMGPLMHLAIDGDNIRLPSVARSFGHLRILPADLSGLGSGLRVDRRRALLCGPCACDGRSERRRSSWSGLPGLRGGIWQIHTSGNG